MAERKLIGILGAAGSGKDTVAEMIRDRIDGHVKAFGFADPFKEFAGRVFQFSDKQLYGPSECRNAPDPRYSFDHPSRRPKYYRGPLGLLRRLKDFVMGAEWPVEWYAQDEILANRAQLSERFYSKCRVWTMAIYPDGVDYHDALSKLEDWFETLMEQRNITPRYVLQTLGSEFGRALSSTLWVDIGFSTARFCLSRGVIPVIKDVRFLNEAKRFSESDLPTVLLRLTRPDKNALTGGVPGHASETEMLSPEMNRYVDYDIVNDGTLDDLEILVDRFLGKFGLIDDPLTSYGRWLLSKK